jgi:osmotically-inducible protein OsmY
MRTRLQYAAVLMTAAGVLLAGGRVEAAADAAIQSAVEGRLEKKGLLHETGVQVAVRDGEATLSGVVTSLPLSREIEKQARKDAKVVHNDLQVHIEEPVTDAEIIDGVRAAILRDPRYDIFDYVEFGVKNGAVLLQGSVVEPWKKSSLEARVARVAGVRALKNDIAVQSASQFDRDLRYSLARRIYGDGMFVRYANRSHPPIRILVDRGNVTLAGWVSSPVEKAVLETIARSSLSFSVENRVRVDGEVPAEDASEEATTS